jgi:hypothetical protein
LEERNSTAAVAVALNFTQLARIEYTACSTKDVRVRKPGLFPRDRPSARS